MAFERSLRDFADVQDSVADMWDLVGRPEFAQRSRRAAATARSRAESCRDRTLLTDVPATVEREYVLRADFELLDNDGCTWISLRFLKGPRPPRAGETVYLLDYQGHGCVGTVERVDGWYACVRPDWSTWTGGEVPRPRSALSGP